MGMKTAETEINIKVTFKANDREHKAFKLACVENDEDMSKLFREFARGYVAKHRRKKK